MTSLKTVNLMCGTVALKRLSMEEVKNMRTRFFFYLFNNNKGKSGYSNKHIVVHYTVHVSQNGRILLH